MLLLATVAPLAAAKPPIDDRDAMIVESMQEALGVDVRMIRLPVPTCAQKDEVDRLVCSLRVPHSDAVEALVTKWTCAGTCRVSGGGDRLVP